MNKGDSDILELLANDKEKAFRLIFDRYYAALCAVARIYFDDSQQAEDIVQQLFIKLWEQPHLQTIHDSIRNYLLTSIRNSCVNQLAKKQVEEKRLQTHFRPEEMEETFDFMVNQEEQLIFKQAMEQLPIQCRRSIELVYFSNQTYRDAAGQMDVSVNTVKSHLKIGLRKLKENQAIRNYFLEKN